MRYNTITITRKIYREWFQPNGMLIQMMMMNQYGGTLATYHSNGMHITSLKEARHTVDMLWGEILSTSDNTSISNAPVPTKLDITNYPNPFNPSTTIAFSLPEEGIVRMVIYNIRGQQVKELITGNMSRGFHTVIWDGRDNRSRSVSSGLYFVMIEVGKTSIVKKITMIK